MDLQIKPLMTQHISATSLPSVGYKAGTLRTTYPLIQQPIKLGAWVEERSTTKVNEYPELQGKRTVSRTVHLQIVAPEPLTLEQYFTNGRIHNMMLSVGPCKKCTDTRQIVKLVKRNQDMKKPMNKQARHNMN